MIEVIRYSALKKEEWNGFVSATKNGTFLFNRDYMDYHADRFADHSVLMYDNKHLVAVFPANQSNKEIISHQGLTYGGLLLADKVKLNDVLNFFSAIKDYYISEEIEKITYKCIPHFYHKEAAFEEQYALFINNANLYRMDAYYVINQSQSIQLQERRQRAIKKALKNNITIISNDLLKPFWEDVLTPNLLEKFGVKPVHSITEMELLQNKFPNNIIQHNAYLNGKIVAGTTVFLTETTAHTQYISANELGKEVGALDLLFYRLITEIYKNVPYFSFGIVNEDEGRKINQGLMEWKEGFDAKVFPQFFYKLIL